MESSLVFWSPAVIVKCQFLGPITILTGLRNEKQAENPLAKEKKKFWADTAEDLGHW